MSIRLLTKLREEQHRLVLVRPYNIFPSGTVVFIKGECDDECGNMVIVQIEDSKESFNVPESIIWDYMDTLEPLHSFS